MDEANRRFFWNTSCPDPAEFIATDIFPLPLHLKRIELPPNSAPLSRKKPVKCDCYFFAENSKIHSSCSLPNLSSELQAAHGSFSSGCPAGVCKTQLTISFPPKLTNPPVSASVSGTLFSLLPTLDTHMVWHHHWEGRTGGWH